MFKPKRLIVTSHVRLVWLKFKRGIAAATVGVRGSFIVHLMVLINL